MTRRILTGNEVVNEIAEVLREGDEEFIVSIANKVLVPTISFDEAEQVFVQEVE